MSTRTFWFPTRRPSYRIVKVRHFAYTHETQQRMRWLWFEWWHSLERHFSTMAAQELIDRYQALDYAHEAERVVEIR